MNESDLVFKVGSDSSPGDIFGDSEDEGQVRSTHIGEMLHCSSQRAGRDLGSHLTLPLLGSRVMTRANPSLSDSVHVRDISPFTEDPADCHVGHAHKAANETVRTSTGVLAARPVGRD